MVACRLKAPSPRVRSRDVIRKRYTIAPIRHEVKASDPSSENDASIHNTPLTTVSSYIRIVRAISLPSLYCTKTLLNNVQCSWNHLDLYRKTTNLRITRLEAQLEGQQAAFYLIGGRRPRPISDPTQCSRLGDPGERRRHPGLGTSYPILGISRSLCDYAKHQRCYHRFE